MNRIKWVLKTALAVTVMAAEVALIVTALKAGVVVFALSVVVALLTAITAYLAMRPATDMVRPTGRPKPWHPRRA